MADYVEIVRQFYELTKQVADKPRRFRLTDETRSTWQSLLRPNSSDSFVIVDASGSGKSTELEQEARCRQRAGQHTVFCIAAALIDRPFREALSADAST